MAEHLKGRVIKILSEFCYVLYNKKLYECKAKGVFRYNDKKVITGDIVKFIILDDKNNKGQIQEINPRVNELYRPRIANIDQVCVVSAIKEPDFSTFLLNNYLVLINFSKLKTILIFTKLDLVNLGNSVFKKIEEYKRVGYEIVMIDNLNDKDDSLAKLKSLLKNKVSVFTGQSGAGKTTTLNNLIPNLSEKMQEISKSLNRGKHTTTKNEIFIYDDINIIDTPGFSSFEIKDIKPIDIANSYLPFTRWIGQCKFNDCIHTPGTPNCEIIKNIENGNIADFFYKDYLKIQGRINLKR